MTIVHRLAMRKDLPRIVEIYNATISSRLVTADTEPVSVESRIPWFEQHTPTSRPLWVVEADGKVAAWLSFSNFYGRPAYRKTAELSIYVHENFQRKGLGAYFLAQAVAEAPKMGIDTLLGFIFGHNQPSLSLFGKFGFARWGELPRVAEMDGVAIDLVIVGRHITSTISCKSPDTNRFSRPIQ